MRKEYAADIICQFNAEGKIIPLKVRIYQDEQQEFKILSYKEKYRHLEYRQGFMKDYQLASQIQYSCKVNAKGVEKEVCLRYYVGEMCWTASFENEE